jgi:hypothetical protein
MIVNPEYVDIPLRASKHDPTPILEKFAIMPPLRLALLLRSRNPELLFCSPAKQATFMQKPEP